MGVSMPTSPPAALRYRRGLKWTTAFRELWRARELVRTLAERELRARYKQAILGFGWAVLTPLALMLVFTLFFNRVARIDTGGVPYPLFSYVGLLAWTFFSTSLNQGGQSLIQNVSLLNRIYCPREVFPMASVAVAGVDMLVALIPLMVLFVLTGFGPKVTSLWVPLLLGIQVCFTLGAAVFVSAVVVYLRDLRHALPILLQIGLFATPVAYGMEVVPAHLRVVYVIINPLAAVIDGYRRTVLMGLPPDWQLVVPAAGSALAVLLIGYTIFKRLEMGFADVG